MENIKLPKNLSLNGNLSENWRKFKQSFEIYLEVTEKAKKSKEIQVAVLLNLIGEDGVELFNTFALDEEDKKDIKKVVKAFEDYCIPKKNVVFERFKFYKREQKEGEKFEEFLTDIRKLLKTCDFGAMADEMLRDRIVLGICDTQLQEKLLRINKLQVNQVIDYCRAAEESKNQAKNLQEKVVDLNFIRKKNNFPTDQSGSKGASNGWQSTNFNCRRCHKRHGPRQCPAFGKVCSNCKKLNHFAMACRVKNVREVITEEIESEGDGVYIEIVEIKGVKSISSWYENIKINNNMVNFKLDTGADVNILPLSILNKLSSKFEMNDTNLKLEAFGGSFIKPIGVVKLKCLYKDTECLINFIIVNENVKPLLGLDTCTKLNLIKKVNEVHKYKDKVEFIKRNYEVFDGLGTFKDTCKIEIKENCKPVVNAPRRIPYTIRNKLKETLIGMENRGIISKVENPLGWVNNLVIVEKNDGSLRVCLDPRDLNNVIRKPTNVLIPTLEDVMEKLVNKNYFTVLDLKDGFWHVPLDDSSSELCTFATCFGCYKFNRLPFGLNMAPEYFQYINFKNFGDIPGVQIYFDDILIAASTEEEHDKLLNIVMNRAKSIGVKFNKNKVQFKVKSVKYLGHIFTEKGMSIDPDRVKAIIAIENPNNVKQLQSILGLINFLRIYIPNLAELTAPLRELLKGKNEFKWLSYHTDALNKIKNTLTNAPILANFDAQKEITIQADASQNGLGCCLLQEGKPIYFASRSMSDSEKNFAQIEKELLGIVFACNKYRNFIYGRHVNVITDHKPLVSLLNKKICDIASNRLQRLKLKLLKYKFNVKYVPGKFMFIADLLSRSFIKEKVEDEDWITEVVHSVSKGLNISETKRKEFEKETNNDPTLNEVKNCVKHGWPSTVKNLGENLKPYFKLQNEIHEEDNLLFFNYRVIVPYSLREYMLNLLHEPHFGINKTRSRAKQIVYWPGMDRDIENLISKCVLCEKYLNANSKEPLITHNIPNIPFNKVATDILEYRGKDYLVIQDYFSKWLELIQLKNKTSSEVIKKLKSVFSTHGIPKVLICDNMPFASYELKNFSKNWNFEINCSSPNYPRSNGQAERAVQTAKRILKKCYDDNKDIEIALLEFRNSPITGLNISPAQLLFNRRTRTKIPIHSNLLKPKVINAYKEITRRQEQYKKYYDRNTKFKDKFKKDDNVLLRREKTWEPARILRSHGSPRSYMVQDQRGNVFRRNSFHLRPSHNQYKVLHDMYDDFELLDKNVNVNPNNTDSCNVTENLSSNVNCKTTRSGRQVKPPRRFIDV